MKKLSHFLKQYFWDVDFKKLNPKKYPYFAIERILEYGDEKAVKWLFKHFEQSKIKQTLSKSQTISYLNANYWALVLGIPKNLVLCLKKQSRHKLKKPLFYERFYKKTWPY